jgi:cytochrome c-type biogenesis protein CcmH/NrfG
LSNQHQTEVLERRIRNDPTNADDLIALGDLYRAGGFPERAINVYIQAAQRYGEHDAWQRVAAIYKVILLLDPQALAIRSKLADVYCLIGMEKDAQDEL